ncbi:MAG: cytochrome c [Bacteroidota bacterium]
MKFFRKHFYHFFFSFLFISYISYSLIVYFIGSGKYQKTLNTQALAGQLIWQQNNCQSCHQIYGLGGYMGPDLTNIMSDKNKGELYAKIIIRSGTQKMPKIDLNEEQIDQLIAFLKQVDESGKSGVNPENINYFGNYSLAQNSYE